VQEQHVPSEVQWGFSSVVERPLCINRACVRKAGSSILPISMPPVQRLKQLVLPQMWLPFTSSLFHGHAVLIYMSREAFLFTAYLAQAEEGKSCKRLVSVVDKRGQALMKHGCDIDRAGNEINLEQESQQHRKAQGSRHKVGLLEQQGTGS
jgi:hypothetical protein